MIHYEQRLSASVTPTGRQGNRDDGSWTAETISAQGS